MKILVNAIIPLFLVAVMLLSCNGLISIPTMSPTDAIEKALSQIKTAIVEMVTVIPTPLPSADTSAPIRQSSPIIVSGTPTVVAMKNGITWTECVIPTEDYVHSAPDEVFASGCLHMQIPVWDDNDRKMAGEWVATVTGSNHADLQQVIGNDVFL